eukprot:1929171-Amphidinium_carterae.1
MGEEAHYEPTLLADSEGVPEESAAALEQLLEGASHHDVGDEAQRSASASDTRSSSMNAELRRVLLDAE